MPGPHSWKHRVVSQRGGQPAGRPGHVPVAGAGRLSWQPAAVSWVPGALAASGMIHLLHEALSGELDRSPRPPPVIRKRT